MLNRFCRSFASPRILSWIVLGLLSLWQLALAGPIVATAQTVATNSGVAAQSNTASLPLEPAVGIAGHLRLGLWTEVRLPAAGLPEQGELVLTAPDGDGIPVSYRWPLSRMDAGEQQMVVGYFRLGRMDSRVKVEVVDAAQRTVNSTVLDFESDDRWKLFPATRQFWLELGPKLELASAITSLQRSPESGVTLIYPADLMSLPVTSRGWESLNRVVGGTSQQDWVEKVSPASLESLGQWVNEGGRVSLVIAPGSGHLLSEGGPLATITGPMETRDGTSSKSLEIEYYVGSRTQLLQQGAEPLTFTGFPQSSTTDLEMEGLPVIHRFVNGLGQVELLGLDIHQAPLRTWTSRTNLISKWLEIPPATEYRLNTTYGYVDMSGQLRSALDQFTAVKLLSFTVVGAMLIGFVALVAMDYFLLRHVIRKMAFTWITLPLYCLLICLAVYGLFRSTKSDQLLANQAEIIDIDGLDSSVHARIWSNVYSPDATAMDLKLGSNLLQVNADRSTAGWNGLAGQGMGGMMSTKLSIVSDRPYQIDYQSPHAQILQMPFDVASTRSIRGEWEGQLPTPIVSRLTRRPNRDRLYGTFTNPLPVAMRDCFIINGGWAYRFRNTFPPGASVDIATQTDPVSLSVWLTRRKNISDLSSTTQPWDPVENDLQRILEMMMFYSIAGGPGYTGLLNQYEPELDMSDLRLRDRAIFLGRVDGDQPVTQLIWNGQALPESQLERAATSIRIVMPVTTEQP